MNTCFGVNVKQKIEDDVRAAVEKFESRPDIETRFDEPFIGYADAMDPLFDMYFTKKICQHPKNIYRPGKTVIVHFVPFASEITQSNEGGSSPSKEWQTAMNDSMWLSMRLNAVIRDALDTIGRLSSHTNTPIDWQEDLCREEWSHKLAAYAAGMGHFGPAGSFVTERGFGGRFGSVITDGRYAEAVDPLSADQLENLYEELMRQHKYKEAKSPDVASEMIDACPAGAICAAGIDRRACQAHCRTIDPHTPSPEVCGKCFFFL